MSKATEEVMDLLHGALAKKFADLLKGDEPPTAAELNVIRQFLKDNGINAVPRDKSPLGDLLNQLPEFPDEPGTETYQ